VSPHRHNPITASAHLQPAAAITATIDAHSRFTRVDQRAVRQGRVRHDKGVPQAGQHLGQLRRRSRHGLVSVDEESELVRGAAVGDGGGDEGAAAAEAELCVALATGDVFCC